MYNKQTVDDKLLLKQNVLTTKAPEGGLHILSGTHVRGLKVEAPLGFINVGDGTLALMFITRLRWITLFYKTSTTWTMH
jgi:hypothetical protein